MRGPGRRAIGRITYVVVAGLVLVNAGCLVVALGAAGGAATAGYFYYKGRLYRDYPSTLGDTLAAVRASLAELQLPVVSEEPGTGEAFVLSRTADDSKIRIYLDTVPSRIPAEGALTRVSIRVGAFGDEEVSARILDQVTRHLSPPPLVGAPPGPPQPVLGPIRPALATVPAETREPQLAPPAPVPVK